MSETNDEVSSFSQTAKSLARNPLGIIALFIVLIYSLATVVITGLGSTLTHEERLPLIYFLVSFPVLVLGVFAWLVSRHSGKLYGPGDYKNEENYILMQLAAAAALAVASAKNPESVNKEEDFKYIADVIRSASFTKQETAETWKYRILWVDDKPDNNIFERKTFEALGFSFTLAFSTSEALSILKNHRFGAIISDMGRREGTREGYVLLDALRKEGNQTPFFIYAGSDLPEHTIEAKSRGAQGSTNNPQELVEYITKALGGGRKYSRRNMYLHRTTGR